MSDVKREPSNLEIIERRILRGEDVILAHVAVLDVTPLGWAQMKQFECRNRAQAADARLAAVRAAWTVSPLVTGVVCSTQCLSVEVNIPVTALGSDLQELGVRARDAVQQTVPSAVMLMLRR